MLPNAVNMIGQADWPTKNRVLLSKNRPYSHVTMHEFSNIDGDFEDDSDMGPVIAYPEGYEPSFDPNEVNDDVI